MWFPPLQNIKRKFIFLFLNLNWLCCHLLQFLIDALNKQWSIVYSILFVILKVIQRQKSNMRNEAWGINVVNKNCLTLHLYLI